jgi:transposase
MSRNIFPERSQGAAELLANAESRNVLVVPIDFAKRIHVVQFARGTGEYLLKRPLNVRNNVAGKQFLLDRIAKCCAKHRIPKCNVLVGGEDPAEYAVNFALWVQAAGYRFVRVNPMEAKKHRTNTRATSDALALDGIAQIMLLRRGYDLQAHDELYGALKMAERARRSLRKQVTATRNRIHKDVELLCPGLLDRKLSGLLPFGGGSLELMATGCSVAQLGRMRTARLAKLLAKAGTQKPAEAAAKLKAFAQSALPPDPAIVPYRQRSLTGKVRLLREQCANLACEENEMARCLVQTPGFLLTSIPGLGVVLGGGIVAECGDPDRWPDPDRIASYAGLAVRQQQTGGPDSEPVTGRLPLDANHHLKDQLLQAAFHVGTTPHPAWQALGLPGHHPLREHYERIEQRGGHSRMGTVKKLLRIARAMMRERRIYLPADALDPNAPDAMAPVRLIAYRRAVGRMLTDKWKRYDLEGIPDEANQLKLWLRETDQIEKFLNNQDK